MKKWISIIAGVIHVLFAGLAIAWVAGDWDVPDKRWLIISGILFVVASVFIATAFLKLNLDKLFLKLEACGAGRCDKIVLLVCGIIALVIVGFEMLVVAIYFIKGIKMEPAEFVRFTVLPSLSLMHLAMGVGCYLALQYFE